MKKIEGMDREAIEAYRNWLIAENITLPQQLSIGLLCDTEYFRVVRDAIALPNGKLGTHIRILMSSQVSPGAACLTRCGDDFVMLQHGRYATGGIHLECPRGFRRAGESPEETALREVQEETGLILTGIQALGEMFVNTGLSDERVGLFYGTATGKDSVKAKADEGIQKVVFLKPTDFFEAIRNGTINDSFTLSATIRAKLLDLI